MKNRWIPGAGLSILVKRDMGIGISFFYFYFSCWGICDMIVLSKDERRTDLWDKIIQAHGNHYVYDVENEDKYLWQIKRTWLLLPPFAENECETLLTGENFRIPLSDVNRLSYMQTYINMIVRILSVNARSLWKISRLRKLLRCAQMH